MLVLARAGHVCWRDNGTDVLKMSLLAMRLCSKRIWRGQISGQASGLVAEK